VCDNSFSKIRRHLYWQNITILVCAGCILILGGLFFLGAQYVLLLEKNNIKTDFINNVNYLRKQEQLLAQLNVLNNKAWLVLSETQHVNYSEPLIPELTTTVTFDWRVPDYLPSVQTGIFNMFTNYLAEFYSNFWLHNVMPAAPMVLFVPNHKPSFVIPAEQKFSTNITDLPTNGKIIWQTMPTNKHQAIGIISAGLNHDLYLASIFNPALLHYSANSQFFDKHKLWFKVNNHLIIGDDLIPNLTPNKLGPTKYGLGLCLVDDIYEACYLISYGDFLHNNLWLVISCIVLFIILFVAIFYYRHWLHNHVINDAISTQQQLIDAKKSADNANSYKTQFLTMVSHEIRTPLYGVISGLELLDLTLNKPKQKQYMERIQKATHILQTLLTNILDLNKIEQGRMQLELTSFNPKALASDCIKTFSSAAALNNIELKLRLSPNLSNSLIGDASKLQQIINNLLSNAIKFSSNGVVELHIIVLKQNIDNCTLQFKVIDNGCGMSESQLAKLFSPVGSKSGAGLGLTICQKLANLMQSEITVTSAQGFGSTFSFELTFSLLDDVCTGANTIVNNLSFNLDNLYNSKIFANLGLHVLVVEDNPINQATLNDQLEQLGCTSLMVDDPTYALALNFEQLQSFDLILTDINLPNISGYDFTKKLRELGITIAVIGITANVFNEQLQKAQDCGMNGCLTKPISLLDLEMRLAIASNKICAITPKFAQIFKQTMLDDLAQLELAINNNDVEHRANLLHRISGSLAVTDNKQLAQKCYQLQNDFKHEKWLKIKTLVCILLRTCEV